MESAAFVRNHHSPTDETRAVTAASVAAGSQPRRNPPASNQILDR